MIASEFLKTFKLEFPELYHVIFIDLCKYNFGVAIEIVGGKEMLEDIQLLHNVNNDNSIISYRKRVLEYFRNNTHKHNEWIAQGKLHLL